MIDILSNIDTVNKQKDTHLYMAQVFSPSFADFVPWDVKKCNSLDKLVTEIVKSLVALSDGKPYDEVINTYNELVRKGEITVYCVDLRRLTIDAVDVESLVL